jgi:hypothetical protein
MRRHVEICPARGRRFDPALGARRLSQIFRFAPRLSSAAGSARSATRASLLALVLAMAMASLLGGLGQPSAHASVFTDFTLPTITGEAVEGQTLSEVHATWSSPPAAYAYQWQHCNSAGNDCESIPKANAQTYRLTAGDVGFRIRVGESARDAEGAVTPSVSEPTAPVQAGATSEHSGGGGSSGGGGPPVACCGRSAPGSSAAQIKALLARQLAPPRKSASIAALLAHGGLRASFKLPQAGALVVKWYLLSRGAKPKLVAAGHAVLGAAKTGDVRIGLTAAGRALLAHARKLTLEATGTFTPKGLAAIRASRKLSLRR